MLKIGFGLSILVVTLVALVVLTTDTARTDSESSAQSSSILVEAGTFQRLGEAGSWLDPGQEVSYQALPNSGFTFSHWELNRQNYFPGDSTSDVEANGDTIVFIVRGPTDLLAHFVEETEDDAGGRNGKPDPKDPDDKPGKGKKEIPPGKGKKL